MATALRVEGISKRYRIYDRPNDRLKEMLTRGYWKRHQEFWALQDINFEIEAGTTTGIIGPNGSGKSTLLQIMTGTLEPTHGSVWHEGRIAALLELGSGFNSEFTGIENIFMNAALMGFSRSETEGLLPEIERFAEIGAFIYQPVKTYSSGMYVRLAFSVAISAAPQILIIDEALAVGDAVFQHRCMRRLKEMQESGVTIFFVSHDLGSVRALCSRAILLHGGRAVADGKPTTVLNHYQKIIMAREDAFEREEALAEATDPQQSLTMRLQEMPKVQCAYRHGNGSAEVVQVELLDNADRKIILLETSESVTIKILVWFHVDLKEPVFGFLLRNRHGVDVYGTNTDLQQIRLGNVRSGEVVEILFPFDCWLAPDSYSVTVAVHSRDGISYDWLDGVLLFQVVSQVPMNGIANLNALASVRRFNLAADEPVLATAGTTYGN